MSFFQLYGNDGEWTLGKPDHICCVHFIVANQSKKQIKEMRTISQLTNNLSIRKQCGLIPSFQTEHTAHTHIKTKTQILYSKMLDSEIKSQAENGLAQTTEQN